LPPPPVDEQAHDAPDLTVSVVTYNSADCLEALFSSISMQNGTRWELFLVDNASADGTAEKLKSASMGDVTFNAENVGFGKGHNQNLGRFRGRHVLFLNPDVIFPPGFFDALVKQLDESTDVAVTGPMVREGSGRIPFPPRRYYPGEAMIPLEPGLRRSEPAWVNGCCFAVRRSVFEAMGGFDPDYPLYFEETDLCLRIRRAGYRIGWLPEFEILHHGRRSQSDLSEYQKDCNLFSGLTIFWQKQFAPRDVRSMLRFQYAVAALTLFGREFLPEGWKLKPTFRPDRLRARRDVSREWLKMHKLSLFPIDFRTWRILARVLHLWWAWLRGGRKLDLDHF
jgi:GT2 family glycosyltransferase